MKRRKQTANVYRHTWEANNGRENDYTCTKCGCRKVTLRLKTTYIQEGGAVHKYAPECKKRKFMALERINTDTKEGRLLVIAIDFIRNTLNYNIHKTKAELLEELENLEEEYFKTDGKG